MVLQRNDWRPTEGLLEPRPLAEGEEVPFAQLHDQVFPDVYVSGRDILGDLGKNRFVYVLEENGALAAYGVLQRRVPDDSGNFRRPPGAAGPGIWPGHSELSGEGGLLQAQRGRIGPDCGRG